MSLHLAITRSPVSLVGAETVVLDLGARLVWVVEWNGRWVFQPFKPNHSHCIYAIHLKSLISETGNYILFLFDGQRLNSFVQWLNILPVFKSCFYHLLLVWLWTNNFTPLCSKILIGKMGMGTVQFQDIVEDQMR